MRLIKTMPASDAREQPRQRMIDDVRELITALERRVPRLEHAVEIEIARDAAALRDKALARLVELQSLRD